MIKKSLTQAIAMATMFGAAGVAQAADMHVNHDGLGEVLLYSLYTAENGNSTNVRITNTTDRAKAVKVRFVEGQNSEEVLDFNLYLSPRDQWSGAVVATENGAKLITSDKSCTAPMIKAEGVEFRDFQYRNKGGDQSLARTRVGHIEVIEMGVLDADLEAMVTANHDVPGSAPANCAGINAKFKNPSDPWYDTTTVGAPAPGWVSDLQAGLMVEDAGVSVTGGLYGSANIVNLDKTTQVSYDAVAIDDFIDPLNGPIHALTGSVLPNLNQGQTFAAFKDGTDGVEFGSSIEAVSALLMKASINNDFNTANGMLASTNWVVTFPTKRYHVDTHPASAPFVNGWNEATGTSCHTIDVAYWDHEEYDPKEKPTYGDIDFSPLPPADPVAPTILPALCYETNILAVDGKSLLTEDNDERLTYTLNLNKEGEAQAYKYGWIQVGFSANVDGTPYELTDLSGLQVVKGLPAIGFSATTISNSKKGAFYGSSTAHKSKTTFDR